MAKAEKPPAKAPAPKHTVAVLDDDGVLQGFETVKVIEKGRVVVPADCDLAPGRYRWDREAGAFVPLGRPGRVLEMAASAMDPVTVLGRALSANRDGRPLPEDVRRWIEWFDTTIDGKG